MSKYILCFPFYFIYVIMFYYIIVLLYLCYNYIFTFVNLQKIDYIDFFGG